MKKLWIAFGLVMVVSFSILGWIGTRIYQEKPPIPVRVVTSEGQVLISDGEIERGQNVWQSMGGMEVGSIWGHGSYVAPDWTADWLHRELMFVLDEWSRQASGGDYSSLSAEEQARLRGRLEQVYRANTFDPQTGTITVEPVRGRAFAACLEYYSEVFRAGNAAYSIPAGAIRSEERMQAMAAFIFWTAWASATNRPGADLTYTHNWPHEALIGNRPSGEMVMWTGVSIIMLLAGICALVWWHASEKSIDPPLVPPPTDPLGAWKATPSQRATLKYFWIVSALVLVQMLMGVVTAHYGVEGNGFYGIDLAQILPYAVSRTWHVQLGIFWIATAWLAAGLFMGPLVSGHEPKYQKLGVDVLFGALLLIVVGSLAGEWLSIQNRLSDSAAFLWGHQGYEYLDLGRGWQWLLFIGLLLWLFLTLRPLVPMLKQRDRKPQLLWLFVISSASIALFYGAGLTWGQHTHISIVEYWRWWVVHLWVEGFFEVFATTVIAFFFSRLGLVHATTAAKAALLATAIYLAGGIIGTCHHLYFSGTPTVALAWGSVFSALEVVPLTLVAFPAIDDLRRSKLTAWAKRYRWPVYFFIAVAFWNMVGAGLFGFMINPPIALYYMQGLNTTPVHGHAALFGVYGLLGVGLMLVCLRVLMPDAHWNERRLGFAFWAMNSGLFIMCVGSLLPVGLLQTLASVDDGYWYARSSEFLHTPLMQTLRWLRVPGDTIFALGELALVWFVFTLRRSRPAETVPGAQPVMGD